MKKAGLLFCVLTASAALLTGCNVLNLLDTSEYNRIRHDNEETANGAYESYVESSAAVKSEKEKSAAEESSRIKAEKKRLLEAQQSSEKPDSEKTEEELLRDYADGMIIEGQGTIPSTKEHFLWKINKYSIADYNSDGHPELILQYYCRRAGEIRPQGVALEIIRYRKGAFCSYSHFKDLSEYMLPDDKQNTAFALVDELYIDAEKQLCILHTYKNGSNPPNAVYDTYSISSTSVKHEERLYVSISKYTGKFNISDPSKCGFAIVGDQALIYRFFTNPEHPTFYDKDMGSAHQRAILNAERPSAFVIPQAVVHKMERKEHYDSSTVRFLALDEMEAAYQKLLTTPRTS